MLGPSAGTQDSMEAVASGGCVTAHLTSPAALSPHPRAPTSCPFLLAAPHLQVRYCSQGSASGSKRHVLSSPRTTSSACGLSGQLLWVRVSVAELMGSL